MQRPSMALVTHTLDRSADFDRFEFWLLSGGGVRECRELASVCSRSLWRITATKLGSSPYRYFECLFLQGGRNDALAVLSQAGAARRESWPRHEMEIVMATQVAAPRDDVTTDHMLFVPNSPRSGAVADGFEDWLQEVDSPAINGMAGVVNYSGWRVDEVLSGSLQFTNYDLIYVEDSDGFERVYGNPAMISYEEKWVELWGAAPGAPISDNFPVLLAERIASDSVDSQAW